MIERKNRRVEEQLLRSRFPRARCAVTTRIYSVSYWMSQICYRSLAAPHTPLQTHCLLRLRQGALGLCHAHLLYRGLHALYSCPFCSAILYLHAVNHQLQVVGRTGEPPCQYWPFAPKGNAPREGQLKKDKSVRTQSCTCIAGPPL